MTNTRVGLMKVLTNFTYSLIKVLNRFKTKIIFKSSLDLRQETSIGLQEIELFMCYNFVLNLENIFNIKVCIDVIIFLNTV
jgi:hypothetical protein